MDSKTENNEIENPNSTYSKSPNNWNDGRNNESTSGFKLHGVGVPLMSDEHQNQFNEKRKAKANLQSSSHETNKEDQAELIYKYDFRKLYNGLQRHLLLILALTILFAGLGAYFSHYLSKTYKAESIILYQEDKPRSVSEGQPLIFFSLPTVVDLIKLPSNFEMVKTILGLDLSPEEIGSMVSIPVPKDRSNFIRIIAKGDNSALVTDIVNTLARVAVKNSKDFYLQQLQMQKQAFKTQYEKANQQLAMQSQEIEDFKNKYQYYDMDPAQSTFLTEINNAKMQLLSATLQYNSLVVEYDNLKKQAEYLPEHLVNETSSSNFLSPIEVQINTVESTLLEARAKYAAGNPKIKILEEQLKALQDKAKKQLGADKTSDLTYQKNKNLLKEKLNIELLQMDSKVRGAQKLQEDLAQELANKEKQLVNLPQKQMAFARLIQNKLLTEGQIKNLDTSLQSLDVMLNNPVGELELYQFAQSASHLSESLPFGSIFLDFIPILGLLLGAFFGISIALFIEAKDQRICTPKQLDYEFDLPTLVSIPEIPFLSKKNGEEKTLYFMRNLVEHLDHICKNSPLSSLAITSSIDGEGKSCIAYYLALYYQRLGQKVILLDLDYNTNPFVDQNGPQTPSIESFLHGKAALKDIIISGKPDRIKVGNHDSEINELVKSERMINLMNALKTAYDLIIIDTPGIVKEDYAVNLNFLADQSLFVIGSSKVQKKFIEGSLKELKLHDVIPCGAILNLINPIYIEDVRVKEENRRSWKRFFQRMISGKKS